MLRVILFFLSFAIGFVVSYITVKIISYLFRKYREHFGTWGIFVVMIPLVLAVVIRGEVRGTYGAWWEDWTFWSWFIFLSTLSILTTLAYIKVKEFMDKKRVSILQVQLQPQVSTQPRSQSKGMDLFADYTPKNKVEVKKEEEKRVKKEDYKLLAREIAKEITKKHLSYFIVGQEKALELIELTIKGAVKELLAGNRKREKILASFLLVGTTGVGKTETAKAVAKILKDLGYEFLRVDMNQFKDEHSLWTLLGSPRGYLGSEKGGLIPSAFKENPRRVLLFDEVEKAHPQAIDFLLQFLDEGYVIERESGKKYEPELAIVFFTSNYLAKEIGEFMEKDIDEVVKEIEIRKMLEGFFKPELLGRIDEVIPYKPLTFEDLVEITRRTLRNLKVNADPTKLTEKYYDFAREYGVRFFIKKITKEVVKDLEL